MPFVGRNNLKIFYEQFGKGEPIFLLHHGFGSSSMWKGIFTKFIMRGYSVIMYDRRGFGQSEGGPDFQEFYESDDYRSESIAEFRFVKETLGISKFNIIGQCEGGVIAVDYASEYPEEVSTIVTASTQCYAEIPESELNRLKFKRDFNDLDTDIRAKMELFHGENAEIRYNQFAKYGGAYGKDYFDIRPALNKVKCPALVLYPDRSAIFEVEQAVEFYRNLSMGELAVIPKCGHNTYEQKPEEYIRIILSFLFRHSGGKDDSILPDTTCLA